jgi:hypothetical protein
MSNAKNLNIERNRTGKMTPKRDEFEYDVFISYSHRDEDWVCNWLEPRLRKRRLRVCVDREAFEPGEPSMMAMSARC